MGYILEGRLVEICSCSTFCPCWAGLDPDNGACHFSWIFHFDHGHIDGVNMARTNLGIFGVLPGNAASGQGRAVAVLDENNNDEQNAAIVRMLHGELGGPLHELTKLLKELVAIEKAPIEFDVDKGSGTYEAGDWFSGESEVFRSPLLHRPTEIRHTALAPILGDPLYPGRVKRHHIHDPKYGMEFTAHQSSQTNIRYVWL